MAQFLQTFCIYLIVHNISGYFIDSHSNCSNVRNAIDPPDPRFVTNLGKFNSTEECINECIKRNCDSYTYFNSDNMNIHAFECWSYINNIIWLPYTQLNTDCGRIIYPCKNNLDCSLNGECNVITGNCTCDKQWNGYKCHYLSLLPASKDSGYLPPFTGKSIPTTTSWGGTVQYDNITSKYIMLVSEMENHCGISSWIRNSAIIFAETTNINSWNEEFIRKSTLIIPWAHSPDLIYASDTDEFVLFHVGNSSWDEEPPCTQCINGTTSNCNAMQNVSEISSFISIKSTELSNGYNINEWSKQVNIDIISTFTSESNFAAVINNDSSLIGMIREPPSWPHLVTAKNWKDNTTYDVHREQLFPYLTGDGTEDMFIYKDCNNYYHALFHNMDPKYYDQELCGAHGYSIDGINWYYGGLAYNNKVEFTDGSSFTFSRRERPHLIFDYNDKCTPVALTNAAQYYQDKAYTLVQPINH